MKPTGFHRSAFARTCSVGLALTNSEATSCSSRSRRRRGSRPDVRELDVHDGEGEIRVGERRAERRAHPGRDPGDHVARLLEDGLRIEGDRRFVSDDHDAQKHAGFFVARHSPPFGIAA
jgi:hypothetical protein